jgi:hypothetical protein
MVWCAAVSLEKVEVGFDHWYAWSENGRAVNSKRVYVFDGYERFFFVTFRGVLKNRSL